ncbi:MAG TPA: serine hydrolase domain-containing protein, partial [Flavisolibacter sp.]|nr:serine hydrolase domain-containing protein [Flavisolibacter sp.]
MPGFMPVADVSVVVVVVLVESAVSEPCVLLSLQDQIIAARKQAASANEFFFIKDFCWRTINLMPAIRLSKVFIDNYFEIGGSQIYFHSRKIFCITKKAYFVYSDELVMKKTFSFFCLIISFACKAQPSFITDSLDGYINRGLKDWDIPGLSVVIVKDGNVVVMKGYGVRDMQTQQAVDENTLFMIASNTKLFTGTALAL